MTAAVHFWDDLEEALLKLQAKLEDLAKKRILLCSLFFKSSILKTFF